MAHGKHLKNCKRKKVLIIIQLLSENQKLNFIVHLILLPIYISTMMFKYSTHFNNWNTNNINSVTFQTPL